MMNRRSHTALLLLLCTLPPTQVSLNANQKQRKEVERQVNTELQERRATAVSLLQSLAVEARSYRDEVLRARVQARIADVIWNQDEGAARALFVAAWDIAETLDGSSDNGGTRGQRNNNARIQQRTLRREILQLAARRDSKLCDEFLTRLTKKDPFEPASTEPSSVEVTERLFLAHQHLAANNIERALQLAEHSLTIIDERALLFLVDLRDKDAGAADKRFAWLLLKADQDLTSDANTVSLLGSYVFTPHIYVVVSRTGIPSSNSYPARSMPQVNPTLRRTFLEVAARILIRPLSQIDRSSAGRPGTFFIANRLLPLFQQFAPDLVAPITAQLASMGPEAGRATSNAGELALNRGLTSDSGSLDVELMERLDRAKNADQRDRAYAFAAIQAAQEVDLRAHDFADKIEDAETRKGVKKYVDYFLIRSFLNKKQADKAVPLLRKLDLPHILRAHFLAAAGTLVLKSDRVRGLELLDEALAYSQRVEQGTSEQAYALLNLLRQFSTLDRTRMWELLGEAVKAINRTGDFTGENGNTSVTLEGKFSIRLTVELAPPTELGDVFEQLAQESFYQALDVSKTITGDAPRALAMIAIARAVLDDKRNK